MKIPIVVYLEGIEGYGENGRTRNSNRSASRETKNLAKNPGACDLFTRRVCTNEKENWLRFNTHERRIQPRTSMRDDYEVLRYTLEYLPGGSIKVDYYLSMCILLLFVHPVSACSYSFLIKPARQHIPK